MMDTALPASPVTPLGLIDKLRVLLASAAAVVLLVLVGWVVAEPADPDMGVTLVARWSRVATVWPALMVMTAVAGVIGTVISPRRLPEAGVFAAAIGLAGLALKGGSMQDVLGYMGSTEPAGRRELMTLMALDSLLWGGVIVVTWIVTAMVRRWLWAEEDLLILGGMPRSRGPGTTVAAAGWPAMVITGLVAVFFIRMTVARTEVATIARGQVAASVAGGFYLGAMAARYFTGRPWAWWYLLAVPAAALLAYLVGYLNAGMGWADGTVYQAYAHLKTTPTHALARPLPIEYLSIGVAATLAGFWSGEKMEPTEEGTPS